MIPKIFVIMAWTMVIGVHGDTENPVANDFILGSDTTLCAMEALIMNVEDCQKAATAFGKNFKDYIFGGGLHMGGGCSMKDNAVYFNNWNYGFMRPGIKPICRRKETLEKKSKDEMFKEMSQTISTAKENKAQIQENEAQISYLKGIVKSVVGKQFDNIIRDSTNDNKKCGHAMMTSHRLFILNGNDANEENCKAKCAQNENCVAFSGIWNKWCIGCDVNLTTKHQGSLAFKKDEGIPTAQAISIAEHLPNAPGCWIRYPSGCPNQKSRPQYNRLQNKLTWNRDNFRGASNNRQNCFAREQPLNNWCGVDDIIVQYV